VNATCDVGLSVRSRAAVTTAHAVRGALAAALLLLPAIPAAAQRATPPLLAPPAAGGSPSAPDARTAGLARLRTSLASESPASSAVTAARSPLRTLGWTMAGATVGAGLGFFASQVAHSNWDDDTERRGFRMRFTVSGALLGAVGGLLVSRQGSIPYASAPAERGRARDVIATTELRSAGGQTAYDVVQALRPVWLSARGVDSFDENPSAVITGGRSPQVTVTPGDAQVVVYLDGTRLGSVDRLREMPANQIKGMRYYDAREATLRWGQGHNHGVIELLTTELSEGGAWIRG